MTPMCFQDVLIKQLKTLNEATCELTAIMDKLVDEGRRSAGAVRD